MKENKTQKEHLKKLQDICYMNSYDGILIAILVFLLPLFALAFVFYKVALPYLGFFVFILLVIWAFLNLKISAKEYFYKHFLDENLKNYGFKPTNFNKRKIIKKVKNMMYLEQSPKVIKCYENDEMLVYDLEISINKSHSHFSLIELKSKPSFKLWIFDKKTQLYDKINLVPLKSPDYKKYDKLHLDNVKFNDIYEVYSNDKVKAFKVLNPDFIEEFMLKISLFDDDFKFFYEEDKINVLINKNIFGFNAFLVIDENMTLRCMETFKKYFDFLMFLKNNP